MRAWQIEGAFGFDNLQQVELTPSPIMDNEIRVKIHACSLNFRDLMVIKGQYNPKQKLPLIPLSDGAGEVIEVGPLVTSFKTGDRVCGTFSQTWCHGLPTADCMRTTLGSPLDGMLQESRIFKEEGLVKFPDYLSFEEAATLPCAALTAFNAIAHQSNLRPGDTVLLEGTGGVSLFALQFAHAFKMKSIIISSSQEKLAKAKEMRADHCINYTENTEWQNQVLEYTQGLGVDAVVEVGGAQTLGRAISSVKKGGTVCVIGVLSGSGNSIDLRPLLMNNIRLQGIFVGPKTLFLAMNRVLSHAKIHPVIDRVFSFNETPKALAYLESAHHFGKVCIKVA